MVRVRLPRLHPDEALVVAVTDPTVLAALIAAGLIAGPAAALTALHLLDRKH